MLLAIRDVPAVNRATVLRALGFLRQQMRDDLLLAVDGRHHELTYRWDHLPCFMPPDADDTALAWVLLGPELGREAVQRVHAVFRQHEGPDGLYPTYFTELDEWGCPPDFGNQPSIGVNVDVLAFEPGEFVAQGDTVVSMGTFRAKVRATGKTADSPWIFIWKFGGGKVKSYEQFHDPALAAAFP